MDIFPACIIGLGLLAVSLSLDGIANAIRALTKTIKGK
jgi:hypothetical protein